MNVDNDVLQTTMMRKTIKKIEDEDEEVKPPYNDAVFICDR